jgi:putative flippase GtrA
MFSDLKTVLKLAVRQFTKAIVCAGIPFSLGLYLMEETTLHSGFLLMLAIGIGLFFNWIINKLWPFPDRY